MLRASSVEPLTGDGRPKRSVAELGLEARLPEFQYLPVALHAHQRCYSEHVNVLCGSWGKSTWHCFIYGSRAVNVQLNYSEVDICHSRDIALEKCFFLMLFLFQTSLRCWSHNLRLMIIKTAREGKLWAECKNLEKVIYGAHFSHLHTSC